MERTTTIEKPYFLYDPIKQCEVLDDNNIESSTNNTIPILAVDILPSEVPKESSEHFGKAVQIVLDELKNTKSKQLSDQNNISKEDAISYGCTGPVGRGSGISCDVRKLYPYEVYKDIQSQTSWAVE